MPGTQKGSPLRAPGETRLAGGAGFGGEEKGWAGGKWRYSGFFLGKDRTAERRDFSMEGMWGKNFRRSGNFELGASMRYTGRQCQN
ncbi:MAG: hypothetical protein BGO55_03290 [Sphingobacteriales bacterium 50-39]|nr:MAG: hypothetical protein BGO55_03290 [Sphingobacteriales bacterium 50-39]